MATPELEQILSLQSRDARRLGIEAQLRLLPREVALVEERIAAEKGAIEAARGELRELESKRKVLETEIGSAEEKLARYKTQQMQVRKNDEYQALGQEIDSTQEAIGGLEEQELKVLYAIDEAKKRFAQAEAVLKGNIAGHEARIRSLRERESGLGSELETATAEVAAAREPMDRDILKLYDRIAAHKQPVCVPISAGKCGGCHLKVSSEVESASRGGNPDVRLPVCDQCGRIVYFES